MVISQRSATATVESPPLPHVLERVALGYRSVLSSLSMSGPKISKVLLEK